MATETKTELKKIPGFSQGVRANSAMRMVKLNAPICPNSQPKYDTDSQGRRVRVDRGPDEQNCQMGGGEWWVPCQAKGHDPYFTTRVWYTEEDIVEPDDSGRMVVKGRQRFPHEERIPNINQVPVARRMHQGQGAVNSMKKKGRRRLSEAGYEEVCQFRNCQKPLNPKFHSSAFGDYCSREHMELIAADAQGVFLPQITGILEGDRIEGVRNRRAQMLREAAWSTNEG